jgi:deoxyxylulose-5-phosphate synthase
VVNGFGAMLSARIERSHPHVRVISLGIPDALIMQAARAKQLEMYGLTPQGIAAEVRAALREPAVR